MYQVVWRGICHDSQGYSRASREYLLALDRAGVDVKVEPLNFGTPSIELEPEQAKRIRELIQKPINPNKKKILIYHAQPYGVNPTAERAKGYDKVIINTVWETTIVPENWFPSVNDADAVIVPSTQNVQALRDSGVTVPIFMLPHGADTQAFNPDNKPFPLVDTEGTFTFLSVFQWQHRKAPEVLLKAYFEEFRSTDNVSLVIKSYWGNSGLKQDQRNVMNTITGYKKYLGLTDTAPIYYSGSIFNDNEIKGLYTLANAYVLPSRGEGVGLPYLEAMSSGIPAIATGWGGQTDFINNTNGYLIGYELLPTQSKVEDGIAQNFFHLFNNEMKWAEPKVESLRKIMRHCYENQDEVRAKGLKAREDMERLSWDSVGIAMKESLEGLIKK